MASFDFTVDTNPMAQSVATVSDHLKATTAAVTAMEAAVIAIEKASADKICDNVDRGFFSLIRSQVSIKLANCYTDMNAKLVLLMQVAKSLKQLQSRMDADFNRLKREYYKIFHGLDKACENRIHQIDRPAMELASRRDDLIYSRIRKDTSNAFCYSTDTHYVAQQCCSARINVKTTKAIESLAASVRENQVYKQQLGNVLDNVAIDNSHEKYIPVLCTEESSGFSQEAKVNQIYYPDYLSEVNKSSIENQVNNRMEDVLNESKSEKEKELIRIEFMNLLHTNQVSERIYNQILVLFNQGGCV